MSYRVPKKSNALLSLLLGILPMLGCNFREDKMEKPSASLDPNLKVDYTLLRSQVFVPDCLGCHSAAGGDLGNVNLETYSSTLSHLEGIKKAVLAARPTMPPSSPLSADKTALVQQWIDQGAKEAL